MTPLRFGFFGAGFWAHFQLSAWKELAGADCVALCDPVREKAQAMASAIGIKDVHTEPAALFDRGDIDFIDIASAIPSHAPLVLEAARRKVPVICQKPLAADLETAAEMVKACRQSDTPLFVHENFRWQTPLLAARDVLADGRIGKILRARVDFISGFPVFDNQPALKALPRMILIDLGVHTLDIVRFLFGEARTVYARTQKVHSDIQGEDMATVMLEMNSGATVVNSVAYAGTPLEREVFPQTLLFVEGEEGSLEMAPNYDLRITTKTGTVSTHHPPTAYPWVDPAYAVAQSSIVPCNQSFLRTLQGEPLQETGATTGADNYETLRLVYAAYKSADSRSVVPLQGADAFGPLFSPAPAGDD